MPGDVDEVPIDARRVLLDALEALGDHRRAVILVGAQAIYLHTGEGDLAVAPYTSDADLVLNPAALSDAPRLEALMRGAGFTPARGNRIGTWMGFHDVPIDLLVPEAVAGEGRRSADLGAHGNRVARRGRGLEAALIDNSKVAVAALDASDSRRFEIAIAGPAALLVAKLHKIADRQGGRRQDDKDALDVYRLLQAISTERLTRGTGHLLEQAMSRAVTQEALVHLETLFADAAAGGSLMAARAVELLDDPERIAASCAALASDLLDALSSSGAG